MTDRFLVLSGIPLPAEEERTKPETPEMWAEWMGRSLNEMAEQGWLFVSSGQRYWPDHGVQTWVVFRREEGVQISGPATPLVDPGLLAGKVLMDPPKERDDD